jgi:hypothetical protein
LALIWGFAWATFLQFTRYGQFLAERRTWITVVVGVGVDLLIALLCVPLEYWLRIASIIALSSIGIITRSIVREYRDERELAHIGGLGEQDASDRGGAILAGQKAAGKRRNLDA